ncbi:TPA: hypothetical protein ACMFQN_005228 [Pseudomonas aeruginosa]
MALITITFEDVAEPDSNKQQAVIRCEGIPDDFTAQPTPATMAALRTLEMMAMSGIVPPPAAEEKTTPQLVGLDGGKLK